MPNPYLPQSDRIYLDPPTQAVVNATLWRVMNDLQTGFINIYQAIQAVQVTVPGIPISGTTKGDLVVWDGIGWVLLTAGSDRDILGADSSSASGLAYFSPSDIVADGLGVADTDTVDLTLTTNTLEADVRYQMSITSDVNGIKLSGDEAAPGNSEYYGTNGAGTKGYYALPAAYTDAEAQDAVGALLLDTDTLDLNYVANTSISGRATHRNYPLVAFCNQAVADGATYFFNGSGTNFNAVAAAQKNAYPPAGTMLGVHLEWMAYSTAGSNENISIYLRFNDTTDYLIATVGNTNFVKVFENLSMNGGSGIAFNGTTDFYCYKVVCPTWSNNPTTVGAQGWTNYKIT